MNYELELSKNLRIYPVFYILLLEFADPEIQIVIKKLLGLIYSNKYEVEKIIRYNPKTR